MILLKPRRAASAAPASVLVKYGDVPGFVSVLVKYGDVPGFVLLTHYCTASERETTMRAPQLQ